jgi:hypothetical protein
MAEGGIFTERIEHRLDVEAGEEERALVEGAGGGAR